MSEVIQSQNLDSGQSVFFARELEHKKTGVYDIVRAPLKAFELIPVSTEAGPGAETISYQQYDMTGIAKIISNYADDLPRADVKGKEFFSPVRSIGNSYGYSLQEIRASAMANKSLEQRKANAAATAQRQQWNKIAFNGDSVSGLKGWLDAANVPSSAVDASATSGSSLKWTGKTPVEILADLNKAIQSIVSTTKGVERPNTIVLPPAQFGLISTTPYSANSSELTILEYFKRTNPGITTVTDASELTNAFDNGSKDGFIVYDKSPDKLTLEMPQMFEQLPVQERGLEFVVPCHSRIGGVIVYAPLSMCFRYGI